MAGSRQMDEAEWRDLRRILLQQETQSKDDGKAYALSRQ